MTKMPIRLDGGPASSIDWRTWTSFENAREKSDRIGFNLGAGIGCLDFDNVIIDGVLHPTVEAWLKDCPPTFIELSPSGTGLHVWGLLPETRGTVRTVNGVSVEVYSYARYMTVTRQPFRGSVPYLADLRAWTNLVLSS